MNVHKLLSVFPSENLKKMKSFSNVVSSMNINAVSISLLILLQSWLRNPFIGRKKNNPNVTIIQASAA